jgi:hypothetical protein
MLTYAEIFNAMSLRDMRNLMCQNRRQHRIIVRQRFEQTGVYENIPARERKGV